MRTFHDENNICHENEKIDSKCIKKPKRGVKVKNPEDVYLKFIIFNEKK